MKAEAVPPRNRWRAVGRALAWQLILIAPALVRAVVPRPAPSATGPGLLLSNLLDFAWTAAFFVAAAGLGRVALRRAGVPATSPLELAVLSAATGSALLGTLFLAVGFGGLGSPPVVLALSALPALVAGPALARAGPALRAAGREMADRAGLAALIVSAAALAFMLVYAIAPPTDWDSLMYHLRVPAELLRRGVVEAAASPHAAFIGPAQALYLPFLALDAISAPALLSVANAALLAVAVLLTGGKLAWSAGRLSLLLLWGSTMLIVVGMTPRIDVTLALYLLLAQYLMLDRKQDRRRLLLAAAFAGYSVAIKYQALVYVLALSPLLIVRARHAEEQSPGRTLATALAIGIAFAAPTLVKNLVLFGDPVYPFLRGAGTERWLAALGPGHTAGGGLAAFRVYSSAIRPFSLLPWFRDPASMTPEAEGFLYRANPVFLAIPLALLFRHRLVAWLVLPAVAYAAVVLAVEPSGNLRYLVPALAPLTIASAYVLARLAVRLAPPGPEAPRSTSGREAPPAPPGRLLVATVCAGALLFPALAMTGMLARRDQLAYDIGAMSRDTYIDRESGALGGMLPVVNRLVPRDERVLMLYEARAFYFRPHVIGDDLASNWPRMAERINGRCLTPTTASWVLVNWTAERSLLDRGAAPSVLRPAELRAFARRCLRRVHQSGGQVLYRVVPSAGAESPDASAATSEPRHSGASGPTR